MARAPLLFIVGAVAGAAAIYGATHLGADTGSPSVQGSSSASDASAPAPAAAATVVAPARSSSVSSTEEGFAAARLAAYEAAAATTSTFTLEDLIERAADAPATRQRDAELAALLGRLLEIDPQRAVELAQTLRLPTRFLVPLFETWSATDADAAIDELRTILQPAALRTLALAVLETIGNDARGIERVASALPVADQQLFMVDALAERAKRDVRGALTAALEIENLTLRSLAMSRITQAAAMADPHAALAAAEQIGDAAQRTSYRSQILNQWARVDPAAVLVFMESTPVADLPTSTAIFQALAGTDPDRLLALVERFPASTRTAVRRSALTTLAQQDPLAAIAQLETFPPGQDRTQLIQQIAQVYGRNSPDAALAWARSLSPPVPQAYQGVLRGIAAVDMDRALDLVVAELESDPTGRNTATASLPTSILLSGNLLSNPRELGRVAERMIGLANPRARSMVSTILSQWSQSDANGALDWALDNAERLDSNAFSNLASQLGRSNPTLVTSTLDRLPAQHRDAFIRSAASGISQTDTNAALRFLEPYRGQPIYDQSLGSVLVQMANTDPQGAARLLASSPPSPQLQSAAASIAGNWAQRDPAAAAEYALSLTDERARTSAASNVASVWVRTDADAARRWVAGLPGGPMRDAALNSYFTSNAASGSFDTQLLAAYSTDSARQNGAMRAIVNIGRNNVAEARRLLDAHVTDATVRRQAEEQLARTGGQGGASTVIDSLGSVIFFQ